MPGLYLSCRLCGRKQAEGLLSRAAWGHVALADGTNASACPSCKAEHADWERRVSGLEAGAPRDGVGIGGSFREG